MTREGKMLTNPCNRDFQKFPIFLKKENSTEDINGSAFVIFLRWKVLEFMVAVGFIHTVYIYPVLYSVVGKNGTVTMSSHWY